METIKNDFGYVNYLVESDFIEIDKDGDEVYSEEYLKIDCVFIAKEYRRQGKARKILRAAIAQIKAAYPGKQIRLVAAPLESNISLENLVGFYESEGFVAEECDCSGVVMYYAE